MSAQNAEQPMRFSSRGCDQARSWEQAYEDFAAVDRVHPRRGTGRPLSPCSSKRRQPGRSPLCCSFPEEAFLSLMKELER
jgi:hypothetical protein